MQARNAERYGDSKVCQKTVLRMFARWALPGDGMRFYPQGEYPESFPPVLNGAYAALSTEYNQALSDVWQIA